MLYSLAVTFVDNTGGQNIIICVLVWIKSRDNKIEVEHTCNTYKTLKKIKDLLSGFLANSVKYCKIFVLVSNCDYYTGLK